MRNEQGAAGAPYLPWVIAIGAGLIVLLVCVASGWDSWRARRLTLADNDREMSSLASAIAEQTARSLQEVELILRRTSVWERDPRNQLATPAEKAAFLRREIDGLPQIREVTIADENGARIATSVQAAGSSPNFANRQYFQDLKKASGAAVVVSEPLESLADGTPTFAVAVRLQDSEGRFEGVARALVDEDYFRDFYKRIDLGPGATIRLLRDGGAPIVQFPAVPQGKTSLQVRSAIRQVPSFPLLVAVSRDESVALADWRTSSINALVGTGSISAFVALLAFALIRQMRRLGEVNQRLRSSEHRWRAVFENAPLGIIVLGADGHYTATNPAFQRMIGYSATELERLGDFDITYRDDVLSAREHVAKLLSGMHETIRFQTRYTRRDRRIVWADVSMARVSTHQEQAPQNTRDSEEMLVATVEDITSLREAEEERRELEGQLRQSQKLEALGTFAGGIAHDFNNILGAILGYGERAFHSLPAASDERRYVEQVLNAGNRARTLVERILTFSRSGMGARVPVLVSPVVVETIELLKGRLPASIELDVKLNANDTYIAGDATHLHQVVMNLCSNAVLAMPSGGTLAVTLDKAHFALATTLSEGTVGPGDCVRLTVSDTGSGISPEVLERIFNPFFTTRRTGEGTGLGLSLVDGIVREYGGGIDVHSVVGQGSRFDIYLPVTEAPPPAADGISEDLPRGDGQVVLIVDDEDALVTLVEEVLADLGYEPVGFRSSAAALQAFKEDPNRFDVVITDQTMPDLTGLALANEIRAIRDTLPVILCSGYGNAALEDEARKAGAAALLRKPLRSGELALALHRILGRAMD
jgi:PAS domain S-box-containing protein